MPQHADMHAPYLVFAPAQQVSPGRIDACEIAFEVGDAEQIFRYLPYAVALAGALLHFLFEAIGEHVEPALVTNAVSGLVGDREQAADPTGRRGVRDRAIAQRKTRFFRGAVASQQPKMIDCKEAAALAAQNCEAERFEFVLDFRPNFAQRLAQRGRMSGTQQFGIGIIV